MGQQIHESDWLGEIHSFKKHNLYKSYVDTFSDKVQHLKDKAIHPRTSSEETEKLKYAINLLETDFSVEKLLKDMEKRLTNDTTI